MTFQKTVRRGQATGVVGSISHSYGGEVITPGLIDKASADKAFIGRFFTKSADTGRYTAGGKIDNELTLYGGIAMNHLTVPVVGVGTNELESSLQIPTNVTVQFAEDAFLWLSVKGGFVRQGMLLTYKIDDGTIGIAAKASEIPEGYAAIPNGRVHRVPGASMNLATDQSAVFSGRISGASIAQ